MEEFEVCKQCGGTMEQVSQKNASPFIVECLDCGHREWAEVHISTPWSPTKKGLEYKRVVVYREKGRATAKEIGALRKLNKDLGGLPMNEAAERIQSSRSIDLGVHQLHHAQGLIKRAKNLGMTAVLEGPEKQNEGQILGMLGAPVSVGEPGEDTRVIPFIWIAIAVVLSLAIIVWALW